MNLEMGSKSSQQKFRSFIPLCQRFTTEGDAHEFCVYCTGAEHARSAFKKTDCPVCEAFPVRTLRSRLALFSESGQFGIPRGSGSAAAQAARRLQSWGSQMGFADEAKDEVAQQLCTL